MIVCLCRGVSHRTIERSIAAGHHSLRQIAKDCGAGRGCGTCHPQVLALISANKQDETGTRPALQDPQVPSPTPSTPAECSIGQATKPNP